LLKVWKVTGEGAFIDGISLSAVTLTDLRIGHGGFLTVRIGIRDDAVNVGGINVFGRCFGNYPQDIILRMRFHLPKGRH
jgi:predicted transcriptional regulator